jgi:hypothetical protein
MSGDIVIERVKLRRVSPKLGYAEIRQPWVNLAGLKIEQLPDGRLSITPPSRQDAQGRTWPSYSLQPEARAAIEAEIAVLWGWS